MAGEMRENLTYEAFGHAVRELAQAVADDGFEPDVVLSIARGGVFVAGGLAYALDCKNIHLVNVEFYTGVDQRLEVPIMLPPTPTAVDLSGLKVLITDDVADTGRTLELVHQFCEGHVAEARTVVEPVRSASRPGRLTRPLRRNRSNMPMADILPGRPSHRPSNKCKDGRAGTSWGRHDR